MLRLIAEAFLRDYEIGLHFNNIEYHLLHRLLFLLHDLLPIGGGADLVRQRVSALLVLEVAVQQENTRVLNEPAHLWVRNVLWEHYTRNDLRLAHLTARNLFDVAKAL